MMGMVICRTQLPWCRPLSKSSPGFCLTLGLFFLVKLCLKVQNAMVNFHRHVHHVVQEHFIVLPPFFVCSEVKQSFLKFIDYVKESMGLFHWDFYCFLFHHIFCGFGFQRFGVFWTAFFRLFGSAAAAWGNCLSKKELSAWGEFQIRFGWCAGWSAGIISSLFSISLLSGRMTFTSLNGSPGAARQTTTTRLYPPCSNHTESEMLGVLWKPASLTCGVRVCWLGNASFHTNSLRSTSWTSRSSNFQFTP